MPIKKRAIEAMRVACRLSMESIQPHDVHRPRPRVRRPANARSDHDTL